MENTAKINENAVPMPTPEKSVDESGAADTAEFAVQLPPPEYGDCYTIGQLIKIFAVNEDTFFKRLKNADLGYSGYDDKVGFYYSREIVEEFIRANKESLPPLPAVAPVLTAASADDTLAAVKNSCQGSSEETAAPVDDNKALVRAEETPPAVDKTVAADSAQNGEARALTKEERVAEANRFFDVLYGALPAEPIRYSYLWTKQNTTTYPFDVSTPAERARMADSAIKLSDSGFDVYYGVNVTDTKMPNKQRAKTEDVTLQIATVTDIDIEGGEHISKGSDKYAPSFDAARGFLPFELTALVNSGYGLHGLAIYAEPIVITNETRAEATARNAKFLSVIRDRAGGCKIDGVGDLPRILRVPGTRNYKLGVKPDAPLCRLVEVAGTLFSPTDVDARLDEATPRADDDMTLVFASKDARKTARAEKDSAEHTDLGPDYDLFRAEKMLDLIDPASLTDYKTDKGESGYGWLNIMSRAKGAGLPYNVVDAWNRRDSARYNEKKNRDMWEGLQPEGGISALHKAAQDLGNYSEKDTMREWFELHPELSRKKKSSKVRADSPAEDIPPVDDENNAEYGTKTFLKDCPVDLRLSEIFKLHDHGITRIYPATEKKPAKRIIICKTPVVPARILCDQSSDTVQYELAYRDIDGKWKKAIIEGALLGDLRGLSKTLHSHSILVEDCGTLKSFFADVIDLNRENIPRIRMYNKTGWIDDDCSLFVYPRAEADYVVKRSGYDFDKIFAPKGDPDAWKFKFVEVASYGATARITLGVALAAPLVKLLGLPNLQLNIEGNRNIGKSPLIKFAISIFGDPRPGQMSRTFAASPKNRLELATAFSDLPLFLDELESLDERDEKLLSRSIYDYSYGVCNQNQKRDGTARVAKQFSGVRLSAGEHSILKPTDKSGAFKRVLNLRETKLFDDDVFASDLHRFSEKNHGLFGKQWVDFVIRYRATIEETFFVACNFVKDVGRDIEPNHIKTIAVAVTAYQLFKALLGLQVFAPANKSEIETEMRNDIRSVVDRLPTSAELDDCTRALEALRDFVAARRRYFYLSDSLNAMLTSPPEYYGRIFLRSGEVAFFPTLLRKIIEKELGFPDAEKIISGFRDAGFLVYDKNHKTCNCRIDGEQTRVIMFRAGVLASPSVDKDYASDNEVSG